MKISKLFTLLFFLISSSQTLAQWEVRDPEEKVSVELTSLIKSLRKDLNTNQQWNSVQETLKEIDSIIQSLPPEPSLYVSKTRIYRELLRLAPEMESSQVSQTQELEKVRLSKEHLPFTFWTWNSFLNDLKNSSDEKQRSIKEKFILPWLTWISQTQASLLNLVLQDIYREILELVLLDYRTTSALLQYPIKQTDRRLFSYKEPPKPKEQLPIKEEPILKELTVLEKTHKKRNLPFPVNDWVVKDKDVGILEKELKNREDVIDILFKEDLPTPVNDWEF